MKKRLIDKDELLKVFTRLHFSKEALCVIEAAPEIEATPVVRCENCLYWRPLSDIQCTGYCGLSLGKLTTFRGSCQRGEFKGW